MRFDLGELELSVVWVHGVDLLFGGGAKDFDDLHKLVYPTLACTTQIWHIASFQQTYNLARRHSWLVQAPRAPAGGGGGFKTSGILYNRCPRKCSSRTQRSAVLTWKDRLSQQEFSHDAAHRPDIDGGRVVCGPKYEFWSTVEPRADVADV